MLPVSNKNNDFSSLTSKVQMFATLWSVLCVLKNAVHLPMRSRILYTDDLA
jgi:hypothetical protein